MTSVTARVAPHRIHADKPDSYADRTSISVQGDELVVYDVRGRDFRYPLATTARRDAGAVTSLVITRTGDADKASNGLEECVELVNADQLTVCTLPLFGWQEVELQAFCRAAGLSFKDVTLKNFAERRRAYPRVSGAPVLGTFTRKGNVLAMSAVIVAVVIVGVIVALVAL